MRTAPTGTPPIPAAVLLALCACAPALAQTKPQVGKPDAESEHVIISNAPEHTSCIHALISRLLGKVKSEKLGATGAEVVSISKHNPRVVADYIRNPVDLSALAIEQANQTFRNSGLGNITLRLVDSRLIDYDEAGGGSIRPSPSHGRWRGRLQGPQEAA